MTHRGRPWTRLIAVIVAAATVAVGAPAAFPLRAAAADNPANIPGIALPSSTVTGHLGGPIYDVVYRVKVPAGNVLLLSMTGSAGTDFDLYLFDSTAGDIYAKPPVGLVAGSTGPTSTESISYPTPAGGTYYIDLSGYSVAEGTYQLTVRIAADTQPPTVSVLVDGGAPVTRDPTVTLTVVATDDLSGVDAMQFSPDDQSWTDWAPYSPAVQWTFDATDGQKQLFVRVRDRAGNVSSTAIGRITLDTVSPTVVSTAPAPGPVVGLLPNFSVAFSQPILPATWIGGGVVLRDPQGTPIYGALSYNVKTRTGTFVPASPLAPGRIYTLTLGTVTDLAGNTLVPAGPWTFIPLVPAAVTLSGSAALVAPGSHVTLVGRLQPAANEPLALERSVADSPYEVVAPLLAGPDGSFSASVAVTENTRFRVTYAGNGTVSPSTSPAVRVLVRRSIVLSGWSASITRVAARGGTLALRAVVGPAEPAVPVMLRAYRFDAVHGRYVLAASITSTTAGGVAAFSWTPASTGRYYLRLTTAPSAAYANGVSEAYPLVVR